jgi:hypothetical protein
MKLEELQVDMKVQDRWWKTYPGFVKKVNKHSAVIHFTGDETIAGTNRWDRDHIEEFIESGK